MLDLVEPLEYEVELLGHLRHLPDVVPQFACELVQPVKPQPPGVHLLLTVLQLRDDLSLQKS